MLQNRVDRDDPFHTRGQQESNVLLQVVNIVAMSRDDEEVLVPAEKGFDPTDHQPTVGIADLFGDHADGKRPFRLMATRDRDCEQHERRLCGLVD